MSTAAKLTLATTTVGAIGIVIFVHWQQKADQAVRLAKFPSVLCSSSANDVRGAAAETVKVLQTISEGSISQEDFKKAVAHAKFRALEEGEELNSGITATGAGLVHGGKPFHMEEVSKAVEAVSADKLKTVSFPILFPHIINRTCLG